MKECKVKIFVSAYACEPDLGSEIGVGWHWIQEMAEYFDLWVLTRKSNQENIENWYKKKPEALAINFLYFDLPPKLRSWKKGLRGVRTYYWIWQRLTNKLVKQTMEANGIKIYHLLTYGNAIFPASKYGQKQSFVWGPIGVGDTIPREFSKHYSLKSRLIEIVRRLSVNTLRLNRGFVQRCEDANLILCKTQTAYQSIPAKYRAKATIFTDVAVERVDLGNYSFDSIQAKETTSFLTVGRLDAWRGFDLLIEAFSQALKSNQDIRLEILGKGADKQRLEAMIEDMKLESFISMPGEVNRDDYYNKMNACDVVVNPALKEAAVTTAFDSMSFGKPIICVDTGGFARYFSNEYARVIPISTRKGIISDLTESILFYTDKKVCLYHGKLVQEKSLQLGWKVKGKEIKDVIDKHLLQIN